MADGLSAVWARVAAAAARAGRAVEDVTLVAISKQADAGAILVAYRQGHRDFGENRAAALLERVKLLPSDARWHFVGRLQGNKVRRVRPVAYLLHSLDRPELVHYWVKGPGLPPPVLVQVNVAAEPQKAGVAVEEAEALVELAMRSGLDVRGLMTMPPPTDDPETSRSHFRTLAALGDRLSRRWPGLTELSMGMTDDFEVAVEEGATILRVGRAIFCPSPDERGHT